MKKKGSISSYLLLLGMSILIFAIQVYDTTSTLYYTADNNKEYLYSINMIDSMKIGLRDNLRANLKANGLTKFKTNLQYTIEYYIYYADGAFESYQMIDSTKFKVTYKPNNRLKSTVTVYYKIIVVDGLYSVTIVNK